MNSTRKHARLGYWIGVVSWAFLLVTCQSARAIDNCSARINKKSGYVEISAKRIVGPPLWGVSPDAIEGDFDSFPPLSGSGSACLSGNKMKRCTRLGGFPDSKALLSSSCTLYLRDDSSTCATYIRGCTPRARDLASDGAILIDQARAIAGGVSDGDAPGFPVSITRPGLYRLTSDLNFDSSFGTNGIVVNRGPGLFSDGAVTIDLNGHTLDGGVGGCPSDCDQERFVGAFGIFISQRDATVRGGTVQQVAGAGIGNEFGILRVVNMKVSNNAGSGVGHTGPRDDAIVLVENSTFEGNFHNYFHEGLGRVTDSVLAGRNPPNNVIVADSFIGVHLGEGIIRGNAITENQDGVVIVNSAIVDTNVLAGNTYRGIRVGRTARGALLTGNSVSESGFDGIDANMDDFGGALAAFDNVVSQNGGAGILLSRAAGSPNASAGLSHNIFNNNHQGFTFIPTSPANAVYTELGANLCNATTTCP